MRNPQHWMIVGGLLLIGAPAAHAATSDTMRIGFAAACNGTTRRDGDRVTPSAGTIVTGCHA